MPGEEYGDYGAKFAKVFSFDNLLSDLRDDYLCPINLDSLMIEGDFSSDNFQYIKI